MSQEYEVVEVQLKETGKTTLIKKARFNPEIHTLTGVPFMKTRELEYSDKKVLDVEPEKEETKTEIDLSNVSEDKVKDLSWKELRSLAKSMGIPSGSVPRELLQAQVIDKLTNN